MFGSLRRSRKELPWHHLVVSEVYIKPIKGSSRGFGSLTPLSDWVAGDTAGRADYIDDDVQQAAASSKEKLFRRG